MSLYQMILLSNPLNRKNFRLEIEEVASYQSSQFEVRSYMNGQQVGTNQSATNAIGGLQIAINLVLTYLEPAVNVQWMVSNGMLNQQDITHCLSQASITHASITSF